MTMRPTPIVEPGTKHFPPHLVGIQKPVLVKEEEVHVAFDYLSQGKGYITKADIERVIKSLKPSVWPQYQNLLGDDERITFDQLLNQMKYYEAGSFDCLKEAFNLFKGPRNDPLSLLVHGAPVLEAEKKKKAEEKPKEKKAAAAATKQQSANDELDDEDEDWLDDEEEKERQRREREERERELELEREREREAAKQADSGARNKKRDNSITEEDITAIFKRAFPDEVLDEDDLDFLMHAPDLNKNGYFDFDDFSKLFSVYFESGLPYGEPVLPEEWEFISGETPDAVAAIAGVTPASSSSSSSSSSSAPPMAPVTEEEEALSQRGSPRDETAPAALSPALSPAPSPDTTRTATTTQPSSSSSSGPGSHRENREKVEILKKKLGANGFDLQAELKKLEQAQLAASAADDADIDPRYRDLPELFEKHISRKHQSGGQRGVGGGAAQGGRGAQKKTQVDDDDDWDDDDN